MMKPPSVQPAFVRRTLLLSILALFLVWSIGYASSEVDELIEVLNSGDYDERCDSALRLAELGPEAARAVPFLANLLQSGDYWLGRECATALVQIGTDDAIQALAEGLAHDDARHYIFDVLLDMERTDSSELHLLLSQFAQVKSTKLVSGMADALYNPYEPFEQIYAAMILAQIGTEEAIQVLTEALMDESVSRMALGALSEMATPELKPLLSLLSEMALDWSEDVSILAEETVIPALEAMGRIDVQGDAYILTLAKVVGDLRFGTICREYALDKLFTIQPINAVLLEPMVQALKYFDPWLLDRRIVELLGTCQLKSTEGLVSELTSMIKDPRYVDERNQAIAALGALGPLAKSATPTLEWIMNEEEFKLYSRLEASKALAAIGEGAKTLSFLMDTMLDRDAYFDCRTEAAALLGEIGDPAVKSLTKATKKQGVLFDKNELNRRLACYALGIAGTNSKNPGKIVSALVKSLQDKSPDVRREAAMALRAIGPKARKASKPLAKAFHDNSERVRSEASLALVAIGPDAVSVVVAKLKAENSFVRILAASTLSQIEPPPTKAVRPLKRLLNDDDLAVRVAAANAIEAITGTSPY